MSGRELWEEAEEHFKAMSEQEEHEIDRLQDQVAELEYRLILRENIIRAVLRLDLIGGSLEERMIAAVGWATASVGGPSPCALPRADESPCPKPMGHEGACSSDAVHEHTFHRGPDPCVWCPGDVRCSRGTAGCNAVHPTDPHRPNEARPRPLQKGDLVVDAEGDPGVVLKTYDAMLGAALGPPFPVAYAIVRTTEGEIDGPAHNFRRLVEEAAQRSETAVRYSEEDVKPLLDYQAFRAKRAIVEWLRETFPADVHAKDIATLIEQRFLAEGAS